MRQRTAPILLSIAVLATGCGETVSASQRIDRCLEKQPDATKADCEGWEKDGELQDSGAHKEHASM